MNSRKTFYVFDTDSTHTFLTLSHLGLLKRSIPGGVDSTPLFFSAVLRDMRPKISKNVNHLSCKK